VSVVTEPWSQDDDLVLWTLLLAEDLNAAALARLQEEHPDVRYSHGFLFQQLVAGPQPVGALAQQLGVTSQAVSKTASELERLGYTERVKDAEDGRVHRIALTRRGHAALQAGRDVRADLNRELEVALGSERARMAARTLRAAVAARARLAAPGQDPTQDPPTEGR
jgi:DNA-binding MarR family transcriptional regulator